MTGRDIPVEVACIQISVCKGEGVKRGYQGKHQLHLPQQGVLWTGSHTAGGLYQVEEASPVQIFVPYLLYDLNIFI